MASDDLIYGALLVLSIPFGVLLRAINQPFLREIFVLISGIFTTIIICKEHSLHFLFNAVVNSILILRFKYYRYLPLISLLWSFSYLAFFRTCHWYGIPKPSAHSNAVQLLLTLRLVGLASEISDMVNLKNLISSSRDSERKEQLALQLKYKSIRISLFNMFSYYFNYIGILTGPFYTCRTHQDMLSSGPTKHIPLLKPLQQTLKYLPLCAVIFIVMSKLTSTKRMAEDDFYKGTSVFYRYGYLVLVFIWFRTRFYSAWMLAECMAITAGLGAYPSKAINRPGEGPTDLKALDKLQGENEMELQYDFETIHNIKPYEAEYATTFRSTIRNWNMTVQWWLVVHVYKRIPVSNKFVRGFILMLVSSFWHGVHPGYYATFLSAPFFFLAEDSMYKGFRSRLTSLDHLAMYDKVASFMRMRFFEYVSVGAFLLHYKDIWRFYVHVGFVGHILLICVIILGHILMFTRKRTVKIE